MADRSFFDSGSDFVDLAETLPNSVEIKFDAQIKLSSMLTSSSEGSLSHAPWIPSHHSWIQHGLGTRSRRSLCGRGATQGST